MSKPVSVQRINSALWFADRIELHFDDGTAKKFTTNEASHLTVAKPGTCLVTFDDGSHVVTTNPTLFEV